MKNTEIIIDGVKYTKSTFSGKYSQCVGIARRGDDILVINTNEGKTTVKFSDSEWKAFVKGIKSSDFDNI